MSKPSPEFFAQEAALKYDERNSKLHAIFENLHFLTGLVLKDLPARARILCVGAGTGAEILALAKSHPEWSFLGVDPSLSMFEVGRERMRSAGLEKRCEFVHGYVHDLPAKAEFDATLSILVGHFIKREDRVNFYKAMADRLRPGGTLVNAEISFDLDSAEFPSMLKNWEQVQALMGGTPESLATLPQQLREMLTVLPPARTEELLRQSGLALPVRFFQALMICGWYGKKPG